MTKKLCIAQEIVNCINEYSTNETIIGKWINGKPIYRKVVDVGTFPNNDTKIVQHGISNIDVAINVRLIAKTSTGIQVTSNFVGTGAVYADRIILARISSTEIQIASNLDSSNHTGYVIIEYTKTTD